MFLDDYMKARNKAKAAEETNDLQSSEAESPLKRRKKPTVTLRDSSTPSDEAAVSSCPPVELKIRRNMATCSRSVDEESQGQATQINDDKQCSTGVQTENTCCKGCQKQDAAMKTLTEQNHLIRVLLTEVLTEVRSLKEAQLNKAGETTSSVSFLHKFPHLTFPLNSLSDVTLLEEILSNPEEFENGITEMCKMEGDSTYSFVKTVLTTLITNDVALQYSWMGRKGKKPFHCSKIAELVMRAAEKVNIDGSRRDTEVAVQLWLKRAADRKNSMQKKF